MKIIGIIPVRLAATRFPNKPLAQIYGMPMIGHVYHRAMMCEKLVDIYVATCDEKIFNYIKSIGGKPIMTKATHERASDRTAEAFKKIIDTEGDIYEGVLMIQGDEPLLNPRLLDKMISYHVKQKSGYITNLISEIKNKEEFINPNIVKVTKSRSGNILCFSRSPIPYDINFNKNISLWKQLGLILFDKKSIADFSNLEPTELEIIESVDMNRVLENDFKIKAYTTSEVSQAIDIPEDIPLVEELIKEDAFVKRYINKG
jgi:3-deoxy-manno-octulosonate cytidylyltransferase (CMP-KDO synthetase)